MYLREGKLTLIFNTESSNFNSVYKCPNSKLECTLAEYELNMICTMQILCINECKKGRKSFEKYSATL